MDGSPTATLRVLAALAVGGVAWGCAAAALAAHGGRFSPWLDALTHAAPIYLVAGLLSGLSAAFLLSGDVRATTALGSVVAVVAAAALMAPDYLAPGGPEPVAGGQRLTVVQFNAWAPNAKAEAAADWILAQRPDVVVLEEGGRVRDELIGRGGFHVTCATCLVTILSRMPPAWTNVPPGADWLAAPATVAAFDAAAGRFVVAGVHLSWPTKPAVSAQELQALETLLGSLPKDRMILTGDFNLTPWSFALRRQDKALGLIRRTRALFTWPAERVSYNRLPAVAPVLPIDHLYAGRDWATVSVARGPRLGSDHYPVVAVLAPAP